MKRQSILVWLGLCYLAVSAAQAAYITLNNFNNTEMAGYYDTWNSSGNHVTSATYLTIDGSSTATGGGYGFVSPVVTFNPDYRLVSVTARIGAGNDSLGFNVLLKDADDNEYYRYAFSASDFNTETFTTVTRHINNYSGISNYSDGVFEADTAGVSAYHIQGYYSGNNFSWDFDDLGIDTVPEPTSAMLLLVGASGLLLSRHKKTLAA